MNSTFRRAIWWLCITVVACVQLALAGALVYQRTQQVNGDSSEQIVAAARAMGSAYVTRRTQLGVLAGQLAGEERIATLASRRAISSADRARLQELLEARVRPEGGEQILVVDALGNVLASAGSQVVDPKQLPESLVRGEGPIQFATVADRVVRLNRAALSERAAIVVADWPAEGIAGYAGLPQTIAYGVRLGDQPAGSTLPVAAKSLLGLASITLDSAQGRELVADIGEDRSAALAARNRYALIIGIASLAALAAMAIALSLVSSALVGRQLEKPLRELRAGFARVMEGDYNTPVEAAPGSTYHPMIRAFNDLQKKIAEREGKIIRHAQFDPLTGLANRAAIDQRMRQMIERVDQAGGGESIAALTLDLSRFNEINGTLGPEIGDEVLRQVARRLGSNTRVSDMVGRVGGDEFFILLSGVDEKLAQHMGEFLTSSLEAPISVNGHSIRVVPRCGLALYPMHCDNADALRRMANIALLTAKDNSQRLVCYEPGQDEKQLRELAIIHDLPNALKNNELYLQYQPKIDIDSQQVRQVEALVRWRHPQLGFVPPDEFIALLERSGRISLLTDWVFKQAIAQVRSWQDKGYDLGVAVNISANDLMDEALATRVNLLLRHYLVEGSQISIEVTESAVISDPERSVKILNEFRKCGIKVALDDFGTGQTSLALLKQLPLSELKIDKSFVQNLRADSGDAIIVKSIIDLGHNMGLTVTAEGVESNYCWNLLNSYACDTVQGYLVSAPLTADELAQWHLRLQERHVNNLDYSFVQESA